MHTGPQIQLDAGDTVLPAGSFDQSGRRTRHQKTLPLDGCGRKRRGGGFGTGVQGPGLVCTQGIKDRVSVIAKA